MKQLAGNSEKGRNQRRRIGELLPKMPGLELANEERLRVAEAAPGSWVSVDENSAGSTLTGGETRFGLAASAATRVSAEAQAADAFHVACPALLEPAE